MRRKCERCNYDIEYSYILKQENYKEITCPNCGRKLVVTNISKVLVGTVFIMFLTIIAILPIKIILVIIIELVWIMFSDFILPALLYEYKEKN